MTVHLQHPNKAASMCGKPYAIDEDWPDVMTRDVAQADCPECALLRPYVEYIQGLHEFVDLMAEWFLPVTKGLPRTYREKCESVCAALDGFSVDSTHIDRETFGTRPMFGAKTPKDGE